MIDDVLGGAFRILSGFFKDFVIDVVFGVVFYTVGWLCLRILSLGRTPSAPLLEGVSENYDTDDGWVAIFGGVLLLGIFLKVYF